MKEFFSSEILTIPPTILREILLLEGVLHHQSFDKDFVSEKLNNNIFYKSNVQRKIE